MDIFDAIRQGAITNRSQFYLYLPSGPFFGASRPVPRFRRA